MDRAMTLDEAHGFCVDLKIASTPANRSRAIRAVSLVETVRLDAEMGEVSIYRVPSQSSQNKHYAVLCGPTQNGTNPVCACPDFMEKGNTCKHAIAVLMFLRREALASARRQQEQADREFEYWRWVDEQNFKETHLQSLVGRWEGEQ